MVTIPSSWYVAACNEFYWPRNADTTKVEAMRKSHMLPAENWRRFSDAKILRTGKDSK